jgi:hypothetical protein
MTASDDKSATRTVKGKSASYEVGYGKPPRHTQFRKGRSGNPGGRPSRKRVERMQALALRDAFRAVLMEDGGRMIPLTSIAAMMRSQIELAAKGNSQAQRDIIAMVRAIENENGKAAKNAAIPGGRRGGAHNKRR